MKKITSRIAVLATAVMISMVGCASTATTSESLITNMEEFGFIEPDSPKKLISINHWVKHDIPNDNLFAIGQRVDNIELANGCYLYIEAKYAGSFILGEGATLVAPNLERCNSIILNAGAKAWCPNLKKTEEGWFAGNDINRNGTIFVGDGAMIYAPNVKPKYTHIEGTGRFIP